MTRHLGPTFAGFYFRDGRLINAVTCREYILRLWRSINFESLLICQSGLRMSFAMGDPALFQHILGVIKRSAFEQVAWIKTWRVITRMAREQIAELTHEHLIADPGNPRILFRSERNNSIAIIKAPCPYPTASDGVNPPIGEKSLFKWCFPNRDDFPSTPETIVVFAAKSAPFRYRIAALFNADFHHARLYMPCDDVKSLFNGCHHPVG